jgi:hypothetical protein
LIRYKLSTQVGEVHVSVDSEQPHKVAPIVYEGTSQAVLTVKRWLTYERGADGREIGEWAAPSDLKTAMKKNGASGFSPSLLEESMGFKAPLPGEADGGG